MPRIVGGRYGLSSKSYTGDGCRHLRTSWWSSDRDAGSRSVSPTTSRARASTHDANPGHRAARHGARDLPRPRLRWDGRCEQEHDQDPRRRGLERAGRLRLRLEEVGLPDGSISGSGRSPFALPYLCNRRASSAATSSACSTRPTCSAGAADGATLLLNCPRSAGRPCGTRCPARYRSRSSTSTSPSTRSTLAGSPARSASAVGPRHPADLLLRPLGRVPPERRSTRSKRRSPRPTGAAAPRLRRRNQAAVDRAFEGLHRIEVPEQAATPPAAADPPARCARVRSHRHRRDDGGPGDDLPVSALPVDGTYPSGTAAYESATSRTSSQCGTPTCVSSAATAASSARTASSVRATTTAPTSTAHLTASIGAAGRGRSARHALHTSGLRRGLHRLRAVRRGVPGRRAGRPGPQGDQPGRARAPGRRRARAHRVLRDASCK